MLEVGSWREGRKCGMEVGKCIRTAGVNSVVEGSLDSLLWCHAPRLEMGLSFGELGSRTTAPLRRAMEVSGDSAALITRKLTVRVRPVRVICFPLHIRSIVSIFKRISIVKEFRLSLCMTDIPRYRSWFLLCLGTSGIGLETDARCGGLLRNSEWNSLSGKKLPRRTRDGPKKDLLSPVLGAPHQF